MLGEEMYGWACDLWRYPRSLTGEGVRETLRYFQGVVPSLVIHEIPTGSSALDWSVPKEWAIRGAFVQDTRGQRIIDWETNNLSVVGYSVPFSGWVSRGELEQHLHSLPEIPEAIPYVTSYYEDRWGFCLQDRVRQSLVDDEYFVHIDSSHFQGFLSRGEILVPGESEEEIILSSYICHPAMANNELSGPVVLAALARWLGGLNSLWYSYRILLGPETIGTLAYLEENLNCLQHKVRAGWVVTCVGDNGPFSHVPSRKGGTLADRILLRSLGLLNRDVVEYSWNERGSDERQWCAPGVDLPVCSFTRSKYGTYPEYHTSLDDLNFISPQGLQSSLEVLQMCIRELEKHPRFFASTAGEPQMGKRGMYPSLSAVGQTLTPSIKLKSGAAVSTRDVMNVLSMCDGDHDFHDIALRVNLKPGTVDEILKVLTHMEIVQRCKPRWWVR